MSHAITPDELAAVLDSDADVTLIDTRPADNYDAWHVPGAVNYPYAPGDDVDLDALPDLSGRVLTICAKGKSSDAFADALADRGVEDVAVVADGMEGYSEVYETVPVVARDDVEVLQVQRRAKGCLGYVVGDPRTGDAAVVDATRHTETFREAAADWGYDVVRVLDTHVHADHVSGGRALAAALDVPYHLGERATERGVQYEYDALDANETVEVGDLSVKAVPTPGHTTELTSYLVGDAALLTGDALFADGVGRTELQFGEEDAATGAHLQYETLQRTVLSLPDDAAILPGHVSVGPDGEWSTSAPGRPVRARLGDLRTSLDLLALDEDAFVERLASNPPEKPPNYERVIAINAGRAAVESEQEATELELGPNNCAA